MRRRASTNPKPGTPSMHLFADEIRKSMRAAARSSGIAPKLLMASTM